MFWRTREPIIPLICLSLLLILGGIVVSATYAEIEVLGGNFSVTFHVTDVSAEEGLQAEWFHYFGILPVSVTFDHPAAFVNYPAPPYWPLPPLLPEPAAFTRAGVSYWPHPGFQDSEEKFNLWDFTVEVYAPDGSIRTPAYLNPLIDGYQVHILDYDRFFGGFPPHAWQWGTGPLAEYFPTLRLDGYDFAANEGDTHLVTQCVIVLHDPGADTFADFGTSPFSTENFRNPRLQPEDRVYINLPAGSVQSVDRSAVLLADAEPDKYAIGTNARGFIYFTIVDTDQGDPQVIEIVRVGTERVEQEVGFITPAVTGEFKIAVLLSEKPKEFTTDHINVTNATILDMQTGIPLPDNEPDTGAPFLTLDGFWFGRNYGFATGRDDLLYPYLLTLRPHFTSKDDIVVSVNEFEDMVLPPNTYKGDVQARFPVDPAAVSHLGPTLAESAEQALDAEPLVRVLPKQTVIPANGYLVLAYGPKDIAATGIMDSPAKPSDKKTDAQKRYNIEYDFDLDLPAADLATFFRNGSTLQLLYADLAGNTTAAHADRGYSGASTQPLTPGDVIISEIMWGRDRGSTDSQYIEIHNTTNTAIGIDENEWLLAIGSVAAETRAVYSVMDRVSNANPYYQVPGADGAVVAAVGHPLSEVVSMVRVGTDGASAASWTASVRPSVNMEGLRIGSPGAPNNPSIPEPPPPVVPPVATAGGIMITEIMADTNGGRLPQWIEIANMSSEVIRLDGWAVSIVNDDANAVPPSYIPLDGVEIPTGQVVLLVSEEGHQSTRHINPDRLINAGQALLSESGFMISLIPPSGFGDVAGNLAEGWTLPAIQIGRRSLMRIGTGPGTAAESWKLASIVPLAYIETYYGAGDDIGTPGWHGPAGALPVELSLFVAERDKTTGAVILRWETQSERNNAGFSIKRSETPDGEFSVINATMIPGAGTTAEKQSYTYTDTTAKPNVVYYYQIEDISLDGERQTLTQARRLRGHLSASGKAAMIWGALKSRE